MGVVVKGSVASFVSAILTFVWWSMAVGVAIAALVLLLSPVLPLRPADGGVNMQLGFPVSFSVDATRVTSPTLGIAAAEIRDAQGVLHVPAPERRLFALMIVIAIGTLAIVWYGVGQLRKVLTSVREGRPFDPGNAVRIRRVAYVVIGSELFRASYTIVCKVYIAKLFVADGLRFDVDLGISGRTLVAGLIILVLAEVFRTGTELEEDRSLTI